LRPQRDRSSAQEGSTKNLIQTDEFDFTATLLTALKISASRRNCGVRRWRRQMRRPSLRNGIDTPLPPHLLKELDIADLRPKLRIVDMQEYETQIPIGRGQIADSPKPTDQSLRAAR
jgi:hypothetical protein